MNEYENSDFMLRWVKKSFWKGSELDVFFFFFKPREKKSVTCLLDCDCHQFPQITFQKKLHPPTAILSIGAAPLLSVLSKPALEFSHFHFSSGLWFATMTSCFGLSRNFLLQCELYIAADSWHTAVQVDEITFNILWVWAWIYLSI